VGVYLTELDEKKRKDLEEEVQVRSASGGEGRSCRKSAATGSSSDGCITI